MNIKSNKGIIYTKYRKYRRITAIYLEEEKENYILWLPIFFIIGIISRFDFVKNINLHILNIVITILLISSLLTAIFSKTIIKRNICLILFFLTFGYTRTNYIIEKFNFPTIEFPTGKVKVFGVVENETININKKGAITKDIIVLVDKIEPFYKDRQFKYDIETPKKLKIRLENSKQNIYLGPIILNTYLFPLENKRLSSSFDEKRYFYFKEIGGLGYKGEVEFNQINKTNKITIKQKIDNLRTKIAQKVIAVRPDSKAMGIMAILLTGQKNLADKQAIENMNFSGLAHLLSISGLHMMILIGFVMFVTKWILLRSETLTTKYNVFKISALISLLINFLYLLLSGANISAVRAYIMSVILLTSTIIGRFNTSLRSVIFTMFLLIFFKPYIIYNAGFQLSFSAVIIIISIINIYNLKRFKFEKYYKTNSAKLNEYFKLSFILSLAVESATTPFSIYNFNNYSFYNIFMNSFITPIITFFVLPLCIVSLILMPFNLEFLPLLPASYVTDFVLLVSKFIVNLPNSVMFIRSPNNFSLFFMIFGLLWFCLLKSNLRQLGIIFYIIGLIILLFQKTPDVIIDNRDNMILFFDKNFYVLNPNKYEINAIIKKFGKTTFFDLDKIELNSCINNKLNHSATCSKFDKNKMYFYKNGEFVYVNKKNNKYYIKEKSDNIRILEIK